MPNAANIQLHCRGIQSRELNIEIVNQKPPSQFRSIIHWMKEHFCAPEKERERINANAEMD